MFWKALRALTRRPAATPRPFKYRLTVDRLEDRLCPASRMIVTDGFNAPATNQILEFDGSSGTFLSKFADSTYLKNPDLGATQGPDGNIYKENFNGNNVLRFD